MTWLGLFTHDTYMISGKQEPNLFPAFHKFCFLGDRLPVTRLSFHNFEFI